VFDGVTGTHHGFGALDRRIRQDAVPQVQDMTDRSGRA
jgi:hypothetical protein